VSLHSDHDPDLVRLLGRQTVELERGRQTHDGVGSLLADKCEAVMLGDRSAGEHVDTTRRSGESASPQ
jgi:hypothetical protein